MKSVTLLGGDDLDVSSNASPGRGIEARDGQDDRGWGGHWNHCNPKTKCGEVNCKASRRRARWLGGMEGPENERLVLAHFREISPGEDRAKRFPVRHYRLYTWIGAVYSPSLTVKYSTCSL